MKKLFLLSFLFSFLFSLGITFGYSSEDVSNANSLGDQGIVTKQTVASRYRLDDKILRQEVIGMALKIKGVTLPENYKCKRYFADVTSSNDWVCRAIEIAADNGIITRSNKYANPGKYVTRAEALAMVMKAAGIEIQEMPMQYNFTSPFMIDFMYTYDEYGDWQANVFYTYAIMGGLLNLEDTYKRCSMTPCRLDLKFNNSATRAEVFGFTKNILSSQGSSSGFDKTYSNNVISFQYSSQYFSSQTDTLKNVSLKEEGNEITIGSYDKIGDVTIRVRYYKNIRNDNDILDVLGYTESEWCQEPIITDKQTLSSDAITFTPECSYGQLMNGAWKGLYFPKEGILVSILLGQDGQFEVLSTTKNADYNEITYKFMETFRAIAQ